MKICMITTGQNPVSREYLNYLSSQDFYLDFIVTLGDDINNEINRVELIQYGGNWNPPSFSSILDEYQVPVYFFKNKKSKNLFSFIKKNEIDIIIPVGIGIIKKSFLELPKVGCINVHPGDLPIFRGCSCPEWQILETEKCYATAHLMDEGIDTGPIIHKKQMEIKPYWGYYDFRSMVYPHCAKVLLEALEILDKKKIEDILTPQKEEDAKYWQPMKNQDDIAKVKIWFERNIYKYISKNKFT